jgi:hypothetical protein
MFDVTGMAGENKLQRVECSVLEYPLDILMASYPKVLLIWVFPYHKFQLNTK